MIGLKLMLTIASLYGFGWFVQYSLEHGSFHYAWLVVPSFYIVGLFLVLLNIFVWAELWKK